ncbi:MAG TPA: GMC family oxidoreductase N-terminal domain-containing protein [bacterium]|nr:GMC family oxidoreductase N-terminal domain-containing protein [bacterium]
MNKQGDTRYFPREKTALALMEVLFPQGQKLPGVQAQKLIGQVGDQIREIRFGPLSLGSFLLLMDLVSLFTSGKLLSAHSLEKRESLVASWSKGRIMKYLLLVASSPFKMAYLLDEDTQKTLGVELNVTVPESVEKHRWQNQIMDSKDYDQEQELEAEVVVIGTGAGGAAAAYELASRGIAVAVIEEGKYFTRKDFDGNIQRMTAKLYRNNGVSFALGNPPILMPVGKTVGGTTTINSGTCYRTPEAVLSDWRGQGLREFSAREMEPYFSRVEEIIKAQRAEEKYIGPVGEIIKRGAKALGFEDIHPLARNAEGCEGQGICQFGCPLDAKQSTNISFMPRALNSAALLFAGFDAKRLIMRGNAVAGVEATSADPATFGKKLTIRAPNVVVAMGSLLTPGFLWKNGIDNPNIGRHLSIHPSGGMGALFDGMDMRNQKTIPQGLGVGDLSGRGIRFEGGTLPFVVYGISNQLYGKDYINSLEMYPNLALFGFMLKDSSRGRVHRVPWDKFPIITYKVIKRILKIS